MPKVILDLCSGTGAWSQPYKASDEYEVYEIDIIHGIDVRNYSPPPLVYGILAAPPCTDFARSGAHYWKHKDESGQTQRSLEILDACLRIIKQANPVWWALENPVGRLRRLRSSELGEPKLIFDPMDYGDNYTKRTIIWGNFNPPPKTEVDKPYYEVCKAYNYKVAFIRDLSKGRRKVIGSRTSSYFARAFYNANP